MNDNNDNRELKNKEFRKLLKVFDIVAAAAILLSVLLALAFGGFALTAVKISNGMFIVALVLCITGAVKTLLPFFRLKSKLRKMPIDQQMELAEKPKLKWEYPVIAAGLVMVLLSYLLIFI